MSRLVVLSLLLVVCCTTSVKSWVRALMRSGYNVCSSILVFFQSTQTKDKTGMLQPSEKPSRHLYCNYCANSHRKDFLRGCEKSCSSSEENVIFRLSSGQFNHLGVVFWYNWSFMRFQTLALLQSPCYLWEMQFSSGNH